jgi:hypothetical protein
MSPHLLGQCDGSGASSTRGHTGQPARPRWPASSLGHSRAGSSPAARRLPGQASAASKPIRPRSRRGYADDHWQATEKVSGPVRAAAIWRDFNLRHAVGGGGAGRDPLLNIHQLDHLVGIAYARNGACPPSDGLVRPDGSADRVLRAARTCVALGVPGGCQAFGLGAAAILIPIAAWNREARAAGRLAAGYSFRYTVGGWQGSFCREGGCTRSSGRCLPGPRPP